MPLDLSAAQEALRQQIIAAARPYVNQRLGDPERKDRYIGTLVQPAHPMEPGSDVIIPERRYDVTYVPGYGVVCQKLCTSNGMAYMLAACVRDDTHWEPAEKTP